MQSILRDRRKCFTFVVRARNKFNEWQQSSFVHGVCSTSFHPDCDLRTLSLGSPSSLIVQFTIVQCRIQHTARKSCDDSAASALRDTCKHGLAVDSATRPIPVATAVFACNADVGMVLQMVVDEKEALGENDRGKTLNLVETTTTENVPLLVQLGGTGWFAVRDKKTIQRTVLGESAHVKCHDRKGMGAARKMRNRPTRSLVSKVRCRNLLQRST